MEFLIDAPLGSVALAALLALAVAEVLLRIGRRLTGTTVPRYVRLLVWLMLGILLTPPILELLGEPLRSGLRLSALIDWIFDGGVRVLLVGLLAFVLLRAVRAGVDRFERYLTGPDGPSSAEQGKRAKTLGSLLNNVAGMAIIAVAGLMVLEELNVNIVPILTGAGILGLAVGFGAQTLVKDVISGFFLILEDQVRVGDSAMINGTGGIVEAMYLRTIVLRDLHGTVHVFPCGSVTSLANRSKDFAFAVLDVQVAYRHDTDEVVEVIARAARDLETSDAFGAMILAPLEVLGVEEFGDSSVTIRVRIKTAPLMQWDVAREFRRRLKKAFDAAGIEIPFPQRAITVRHLPATAGRS